MTAEGNIIVDGLLASCYSSSDHHMAHFGMVPMRWFPNVVQWMFGIENGFSTVVRTYEKLALWIVPCGHT